VTERRKRLIEVAFPLEEVSAHSRREKNVRYGHISTLHIWWARRPLAACRAFIYESLIDDPEDDREREDLLKEVADLASWDAVRKPDLVVRTKANGGSGLTGRQLLERARQRILACNGGKPPRLLDPFAGGGAIPLEALRLGCEVEASDLNPVAVLILKGTVEYPQKYGRPLAEQVEQKHKGDRDSIAGVNGEVPGYIRDADAAAASSAFARDAGDGPLARAYGENPLATDVRYWGNWMLERARGELALFYPPDPDGSVTVAYLWSRTVPCPNCGAEMPLIRQYWLARKDKKKVALKPVIDRESRRVGFEVVEGENVTGDPTQATTSRGDTLCLLCRQVVKAAYVREAGWQGKIGAVLTSVVLEARGAGGKRYRADIPEDTDVFERASARLVELEAQNKADFPLVPDEPIPYDPRKIDVELYGLDQWGKLFNQRQLLAITTLARLVGEAHTQMLASGLDTEYARGAATYLGFAVDRLAAQGSTLCRWDNTGESIMNTYARQALPMVWDYAEVNPLSGATGDFRSGLEWIRAFLDPWMPTSGMERILVSRRDARFLGDSNAEAVITDPPYYDSINYADHADFFYVWLKRSIGSFQSDLTLLPLTPKKDEIVMNVYADGRAAEREGREIARERYVDGMGSAFLSMRHALDSEGIGAVVFAHTDADAWATMIGGLLRAQLIPDASWPIDTELENKVSRLGSARLSTSVWMACAPRLEGAEEAFLGDVLSEMRPVIRERLLYFWSKSIRGADFFISAIGPALSIFGRHRRVLKPDGDEVTVREFLDLVRRESTQVALEQVLSGADLGVVDSLTRHYVTWVWSYSRAPLDAGETIALCLATGADYGDAVRPGSIAVEVKEKSKKMVKLRTIRERATKDEDLGIGSGARVTPLIDQLQHAAYLWGQNRPDQLTAYRASLGETRWTATRTLGQAVAECLPEGDEDRRLINGLLGSNIMAAAARAPVQAAAAATRAAARAARAGAPLPGFEAEEDGDG